MQTHALAGESLVGFIQDQFEKENVSSHWSE